MGKPGREPAPSAVAILALTQVSFLDVNRATSESQVLPQERDARVKRVAHSSTVHASPELPKPARPSADEQRDGTQSSHTVEYYSAMKRDDAPTHAATWTSLRNAVPSDRSWTRRATWCDSIW